jgi:hypothetical protein
LKDEQSSLATMSNETDRVHCLKRAGKTEFVYIDLEKAEDCYELESVEELTPDVDTETHALGQALIAAEGWVIP